MPEDDLSRVEPLSLASEAGIYRVQPSGNAECLRKFVTCDADEGGPETWCDNCRVKAVNPRKTLAEQWAEEDEERRP